MTTLGLIAHINEMKNSLYLEVFEFMECSPKWCERYALALLNYSSIYP